MKNKLLLCLLLVSLKTVGAFSLSIDQPSIHIQTNRDSVNEYRLVLTNPGNEILNIKVYPNDWIYLDNGAKKFLPPGKTTSSCATWLILKQTDLSLKPLEKKAYAFQIKTPRDAVGGHQAALFFEASALSTANTSYQLRLGSIIYQETRDYTKIKIDIIQKKHQIQGDKIFYEMTVQNNGNGWNQFNALVNLVEGAEAVTAENFGPYNLLPEAKTTLKGYFTIRPGQKSRLLYTLEDFQGNLQAGSFSEAPGLPSASALIEERIGQLAKIAPTLNQTSGLLQVTLNNFEVVYRRSERKLAAVFQLEANQAQRVNAQLKVFQLSENSRLKTIYFNEQLVAPLETVAFTTAWLGEKKLPPGRYKGVLTVAVGSKILTRQKYFNVTKTR